MNSSAFNDFDYQDDDAFETYKEDQIDYLERHEDDFEIPFSKYQIYQFMDEIEESNLFLMKLLEEEDQYQESHKDNTLFEIKQTKLKLQDAFEQIKLKERQIQEGKDKQQSYEKTKIYLQQSQGDSFYGIMDTQKFAKLVLLLRDMHLRLHNYEFEPDSNESKHQLIESNTIRPQLLLKQVENKLMYLSEAYDHVSSLADKSSALKRQMNEKLRLNDIEKRHKKQEDIKQREKQDRQIRYEKNIERMKQSEKNKLNKDVKTQKARSKKPIKIKYLRQVEPTQEEIDYQKYVENI
ncbi:UNKNOWN [Stylonychia lemnae]|uniref:Uncharacterized protein n=1 Tax=Stylonychia lemnae TaxID=5949 RepID=A0A078AY75_STYLE|nr:UNKNOWN [Stylonychia lemnae]|eukprot:CDW87076.1 UNKNOWN [Stylonychia lemnae]